MTAETIGEAAVRNGFTLSIWGSDPASLCTGNQNWGCERTRGAGGSILNPIQSAAVRTVNSFSGKFFNMEVRAKLPVGDWIWPAIWLLPRFNAYGGWPCSGEIDVMESRRNYPSYPPGGYNQVGSALHWGPYWAQNGYQKTLGTWELQPVRGTCNRWGNRFANPWKGSASNATPFDQDILGIDHYSCGQDMANLGLTLALGVCMPSMTSTMLDRYGDKHSLMERLLWRLIGFEFGRLSSWYVRDAFLPSADSDVYRLVRSQSKKNVVDPSLDQVDCSPLVQRRLERLVASKVANISAEGLKATKAAYAGKSHSLSKLLPNTPSPGHQSAVESSIATGYVDSAVTVPRPERLLKRVTACDRG